MAGMDFLISALLNAAGVDQVKMKQIAGQIASDDTLNKVLKFSADLERHNRLLEEIRDELKLQRSSTEPNPGAGQFELEKLAYYKPDIMFGAT